MPKISINLLRWNSRWQTVKECIDAVLASDFDDFELVYMENADVSKKALVNLVRQSYGADLRVRIIDNKNNLGYAAGHNKFFAETNSELLMVLNPDAVMELGFLRHIVQAFDDPSVGAATGKMIKPEQNENGQRVLDGTGIVISRSRRAYERGQLEEDFGQYDQALDVFGVSGTAAVFRKKALEDAKIFGSEYYDPDFFAYWEDLDLSWRLRLAGYNCRYVPLARIYHGRLIGKSPGGVRQFITYIKHHRNFPLNVRRWNWRNHLFAIIKNDFGWNFWRDLPFILGREVAMLIFITLFMPSALSAVSNFFRLLPKMMKKRRIIQSRRKITSKQIQVWFR